MAGAATAVEKKALVFFALLRALRERRCTPREVSIVDDVDGEVGGAVVRASQPTRRGINLAIQTPPARGRPAPTPPARAPPFRRVTRAACPACCPLPASERPCFTHAPRTITRTRQATARLPPVPLHAQEAPTHLDIASLVAVPRSADVRPGPAPRHRPDPVHRCARRPGRLKFWATATPDVRRKPIRTANAGQGERDVALCRHYRPQRPCTCTRTPPRP